MAGYQILGIRSFLDTDKNKYVRYDAFFDRRWRFDDITELYKNPKKLLDDLQVPEEERHNLYYTVASCGDEKRKFEFQEILPFDLDGIDCDRREEYIDATLRVLAIDKEKTAIVFSGNGLHIIIRLPAPLLKDTFFDEYRAQYKAVCSKINKELERLRLPGKADVAIFDAARILRFPETLNIKPDKKDATKLRRVKCFVLRSQLLPQTFDLEEKSGLKKLDTANAISNEEWRRYKKTDGNAAFQECLFLKHAKENAAKISEPEWYAAASVIGRFKNGREQFHEISKTHPGYSQSETEEKLSQAIEASGPRTCRNINALWGGCKSCPHFEKVKSPAVIYGKDVIPTEASGFYDLIPSKDGGAPKHVPNYNDLLRAFNRDTPYFLDVETEQLWRYDGKCYRRFTGGFVAAWCEDVMEPKPKDAIRREFISKVRANNAKGREEIDKLFYDTTRGKINLQNGVLDIKTGSLFPHSSEYGFTYVLPYEYNAAASAPIFEKFMQEITLGRAALRATLLDFMAYSLWPEYDDHCFLWLSGSGRNGKSTYMDILREIVGIENTTAVMLEQFDNENYLEMMNRKLLNVSEESDQNKIPSSVLGTLKALCAAGKVMVSQKYEKPFVMKPTAKLVFASNNQPSIGNAQQAIASRMIVVPFELRLEDHEAGTSKTNPHILSDMKKELPGILNLILSQLRAQSEKPFFRVHRGEESKEALNDVLRDSDPVQRWLEDRITFVETSEIRVDLLHRDYKEYLGQDEQQYALNEVWFARKLRSKMGNRGQVKRMLDKDSRKKYTILKGVSLARTGKDF
jgi:P4 family phage/plasmid primase-like protien